MAVSGSPLHDPLDAIEVYHHDPNVLPGIVYRNPFAGVSSGG
jgi:hypothetical protein